MKRNAGSFRSLLPDRTTDAMPTHASSHSGQFAPITDSPLSQNIWGTSERETCWT